MSASLAIEKGLSPTRTSDVERVAESSLKMDEHEVDKAATFLATSEHFPPMTPEMEKKLKRKLDRWLIPLLLFTATLGAVDKVTLSTASLYGFQKDTHLHGQQYSWIGSILSIGALVGMFPSSYFLTRFPSAKYMCCCSIVWSSMALFLAACTNWSGLMAVRFFMGTAECVIVPAVTLLIASFYKKNEQPTRNAIIFGSYSSIINGFLAWAVGHIPETAPLHIWQYLFLITGCVSFAWSIVAFILLPSTPMEARFLTPAEKYYVVMRVSDNDTGIVNRTWKWSQVVESLLDINTWIIFFFDIAINIPNGGLSTFGSIIIKDLGFTSLNASLLSMPTGAFSTIASIVFSYMAAKWTNHRCLTAMIACCVPIIGTGLVHGLPRSNHGGQMVGLYLLYTYFGPYVVLISLAQGNVAGYTKRVVTFAILYLGYAVGNLIGPQTFRTSQAPAYVGGVVAMIVCYCVCIALAACYWIVAVHRNRKKVAAASAGSALGFDAPDIDGVDHFLDLTDFKQPNFRYIT